MDWKVVFTDGEKKTFFDCSLKEVYDYLSEEEKEQIIIIVCKSNMDC